MSKHITAFISYARSEKYDDQVLEFSNYLRKKGIEVSIDRYIESTGPAVGWATWMLQEIKFSDYILIVCTQEFYDASVKFDPSKPNRKGVRWESVISLQELYDQKVTNHKYIPLLLDHKDCNYIPDPLRGFNYYIISNEDGRTKLLRSITNQPKITKPELGTIPNLEVKNNHKTQLEDLTDHISVTIKLKGEFSEFDSELQDKFNEKIIKLLNCGVDELVIKKVYEGSIIIKLSVNSKYKERLKRVLQEETILDGYPVTEYELDNKKIHVKEKAFLATGISSNTPFDWEAEIVENNWLSKIDAMAKQRFGDTAFATEASTYTLEKILENNFDGLSGFKFRTPESYLNLVTRKHLEDFAGRRFGIPPPPQWSAEIVESGVSYFDSPYNILDGEEIQSIHDKSTSIVSSIITLSILEQEVADELLSESVKQTSFNTETFAKPIKKFRKELDLSKEESIVLRMVYLESKKREDVARTLKLTDIQLRERLNTAIEKIRLALQKANIDIDEL